MKLEDYNGVDENCASRNDCCTKPQDGSPNMACLPNMTRMAMRCSELRSLYATCVERIDDLKTG